MPNLFFNFAGIQDPAWGWGVFYGSDSNSVDQRCRYDPNSGTYDCPGGTIDKTGFHPDNSRRGSGYYPPGNPTANNSWGGGSGCHFANYGAKAIDQTDTRFGPNLVSVGKQLL